MRYLMTFSYDGTAFFGYQKQIEKRTIQEEIEKVLTCINRKEKVSITASGRTDAKVHANNQKAHFDMREMDVASLKHAVNCLIPKDIYIKEIKIVPNDFHARFKTKKKEYIYKINIGPYNPITRNYMWQYNKKLDIPKMEQALKQLIGTHNFKTFTKNCEEKENYERTIYEAFIEKKENIITIHITGNGFLRYMVRNIVGLLVEIGSDQKKLEEIEIMMEAKDRTVLGITAPPNGLYLNQVEYEGEA